MTNLLNRLQKLEEIDLLRLALIIQVGGNNSHWVAIGAKDFSDLISQKAINEAYKKEWAEWIKNNGGAVSSSNYSLRVLAAFTNE